MYTSFVCFPGKPYTYGLRGSRSNAWGCAGCKRLKKQAGHRQQARSGHGILQSDSDSDSDMGESDTTLSPAHSRAPSRRAASTTRHRQGRAGTGGAGQRSHSQGRTDDMDWETEAAELAEEEATLDVSLPSTEFGVSFWYMFILQGGAYVTQYRLHQCRKQCCLHT